MIRRGTSCSEHARSDLFRRAVAEAGRGLPTLEPGAPLPAGTGLNRRSFLATAAGALLTVYGAGRLDLSALDEGIAQAAAQGATTDPVLVSIFLDGGIDSLSVLYPGADPGVPPAPPSAATQPGCRDTVLGGHAPVLTPEGGAARDPPWRGKALDCACTRLRRSRPVALHVEALLRGRSHRRERPDRVAWPLPRPDGHRRQPAAGTLARLRPATRARKRERTGGRGHGTR